MSWLTRLRNTLRPDRLQHDIDREVSFHLAERADELRSEGLSDKEATRRARLRFGNLLVQSERTRDMDIALWMDTSLRNIRYAMRTLTRTPGFTATVVLTLALGIGANSAVFSAINAVLLQPLPFPDGDRLMRVSQTQERTAEASIAPVRLEEWNRLSSTFEAITGYFVEDVSDTSGDLPEKVRRAWVAPRFLDVWRVAPALGRGFTDAEHRAGGPSAVLLSHRYWRNRLDADPNAVGRTVRIGSASFPIVGVMPATFLFPDRDVELWFPSPMSDRLAQVRTATWYRGIGRLQPGVTLEQARANLALVQAQLAERHPATDKTIGVAVEPLKEATVGGVRQSLTLVFGAVSVLLLIACTNIAALLLSRATHRQQEISVRLSLGATRRTVAAQVLTEAGMLAVAGGAAGLLVAAGASAALRAAAADLPRMNEIALDTTIVLYTLTTTVAVALLCGVLPAIRSSRGGVPGAPSESGRTQVSTRNSLQWLLVGTQVALSVMLLAVAGVLVRSFQEMSRVNPGFDAAHVLTFRVSGNWAETANYDRLIQRVDGTIEALRGLPGVEEAATAIFLPGIPAQFERAYELVEARDASKPQIVADSRFVSPEYFATMKIPLMSGDLCRRRPFRDGTEVMVNRAFATRYLSAWSSGVGLHLSTDTPGSPPSRIVGVVGDARERGPDRVAEPTVYTCFSAPNPTPYFLLRTRDDPVSVARAVRLKVKEFEPLRAVYDIAPLEERIGDSFTQIRLRTTLLGLFAITALSLACVGLYGTLSYVVTLRRREVGLRLALGALRREIIRQFLVHGLRVVGVGCLCGLALSFAFGRVLSGMLYGVSASDPVTLSSVVAIVMAVAALAALVPAARAALVEPMQVLRE